MRYFIHLSYQGTKYSGWQKQKNTANTIQEIIEEALSSLSGMKISIHGCGRTDAGVHANQFFAHADLDIVPTDEFLQKLNNELPDDIRVHAFIEVNDRAHTQHDAKRRRYIYLMHERAEHIPNRMLDIRYKNMDASLFKEAADYIATQVDFRAFCKKPDQYKNTRCVVFESSFKVSSEGTWCYSITANRFLRSMIRLLVGRMIDVARGSISMDDFKQIFTGEISPKFKNPAPAHGLYLAEVGYPYIDCVPVANKMTNGMA